MHPLYGAEPVQYVSVQVTRGGLVARQHNYMSILAAEPPSTDYFYSPISISVLRLPTPYSIMGLGGYKSSAKASSLS